MNGTRRELVSGCVACAALALVALPAAAAYQQAPVALKTEWGEKVTPENAWREYPRPQMVRESWTNLNGLWKYAVTTDAPGVPKTWNGEILVPFAIESSLSGVGRLLQPRETLWYRRSFNADVKKGTRLLLHFEQADFRTQVFVNGVEAGVPHEGGHMPFSFDITNLVKPGANDLVVSIWDPTDSFIASCAKQTLKPHGCMYTRSSGITGTVWLETVPETHLTNYRVTTDIDAGTVSVTLEGTGNLTEAEAEVKVLRGGKVLAKGEVKTWGKPVTLALPKPVALWSPETPNLYDLEISLEDDDADVTDRVTGYFGMRKFDLRKDPQGILRFYFNNKMRFITGTLDQGWWPDGLLTPPSDEAMAYDIKALKSMGFDMMRKHIKIEPRRYYYLCDKIGILVLQDMPSGWGNTCHRYGFYRHELKAMIDHLYNVPSIVMWIPYNEGWGQPGEFLTHATLMWTQRYDPTRLVDGPSGAHDYEGGELWFKPHRTTAHKAPGEEEAAHAVDKHNYGARPRMFPVNDRRASFLGEFGGIGCRVSDHLWQTNAWGYGGTGNDVDRKQVQQKFVDLMEYIAGLARRGLAGSVYTQTTDVEGEINGLMTYDRKVMKFDPAALAAVHRTVQAAAEQGMNFVEKSVFPRLDPSPTAWAYTFDAPADGWTAPAFDDAAWKRSAGGFGGSGIEKAHAVAKVSTPWQTKTLWLRRHFQFDGAREKIVAAMFDMFHDEDAEVYLNGQKILSVKGFTTGWTLVPVEAKAFAAAVRSGDNVLAVKVVQTIGGQYFDAGLSLEIEK